MKLVLPFAITVAMASPAAAEDIRQLPIGASPHSLLMRASAWRVAASAEPSESEKDPDSIFSRPSGKGLEVGQGRVDRLRRIEADALAPPKPLSEKLIFRFNLGAGLDSGLPSASTMLSGALLDEGNDYQRTRLYTFADTVAGSKGLGISSLNTYFAAHFRQNHDSANANTTTALPSVFDGNRNRSQIRSAYGEADGFLKHKLLKPVYIRAGRSYHYDLVPLHYDGLKVGYDTPMLKVSVLGGERRSLYRINPEIIAAVNSVVATSVRFDFYEWRRWPLVAFASHLRFDDQRHSRAGLALRWNRDVLVRGSLRTLDGELARSDFGLRARISKVTTVNLQLNNRFRPDWSFGLLRLGTPTNAAEPREYLDLGPVLPRSILSVRYGTVLFRNLDLLLRGGAALDRRDRDQDGDTPPPAASSFSSSYAEVGGGAEIRIRRSLRLGTALTGRRYFLSNQKAESEVGGQADRLPTDLASTGTTSYWEGGLNMHYSPGARQFTANAEVYGRRYSLRSEFIDDTKTDFRSGGRFSIEGWVKDRVRLKAEYDLTLGRLIMAPELRDLRTLRVFMEGSF